MKINDKLCLVIGLFNLLVNLVWSGTDGNENVEITYPKNVTYYCKKTEVAPEIDGKLDDKVWKEASKIAGFVNTSGNELTKEQTEAYFLYDTHNLYIGVESFDSDMSIIQGGHTERDSAVYSDHAIEIFLDPENDRETYFHFVTNHLGAQLDESYRERVGVVKIDAKWNADNWVVKTSRNSKSWLAEMVIPFKDLGITPSQQGALWAMNIARSSRGNSVWSPTYGWFHVPREFGTMVLGDEFLSLKKLDLGEQNLGQNRLMIKAENVSQIKKRIEVRLSLNPPSNKSTTFTEQTELGGKDSKDIELLYEIREEGENTLDLRIEDLDNRNIIYTMTRYVFNIIPLKSTRSGICTMDVQKSIELISRPYER